MVSILMKKAYHCIEDRMDLAGPVQTEASHFEQLQQAPD